MAAGTAEAPSIITRIKDSLRGDRLLVVEQARTGHPGSAMDFYAIRMFAESQTDIDQTNAFLQNPKKCPYGGRVRPVTDDGEAAALAKILPRPALRFEDSARANADAAREGGTDTAIPSAW